MLACHVLCIIPTTPNQSHQKLQQQLNIQQQHSQPQQHLQPKKLKQHLSASKLVHQSLQQNKLKVQQNKVQKPQQQQNLPQSDLKIQHKFPQQHQHQQQQDLEQQQQKYLQQTESKQPSLHSAESLKDTFIFLNIYNNITKFVLMHA